MGDENEEYPKNDINRLKSCYRKARKTRNKKVFHYFAPNIIFLD